jgi:hypothetical protein
MRSHGVTDFPDPTGNGALNVTFATGGKGGAPLSPGINRNSSQYIAAAVACRRLLPVSVATPAQVQRNLAEGLTYARCMRGHGVLDFPDPTSAGVVHLGAGVNPNSPQFLTAQRTCQSLVVGMGSK